MMDMVDRVWLTVALVLAFATAELLARRIALADAGGTWLDVMTAASRTRENG